MKPLSILSVASLIFAATQAPAAITLTDSSTVIEDFDGLPLTGSAGFFPADGSATAITGTLFDGAKAGGTSGDDMSFNAGTGTSATSGVYSYGADGVAERALGSQSAGTHEPAFGVVIINSTGNPIPALRIEVTQENWRSSTVEQNVTPASWAVGSDDAAGITAANYLTSGSTAFTDVTTLDLVGPPFGGTAGELDGNLAENQAARLAILTFGTPLADGDRVYLRWRDSNNGGIDAGLAIDNFRVTPVPEPSAAALAAAGIALALRRRRSGSRA